MKGINTYRYKHVYVDRFYNELLDVVSKLHEIVMVPKDFSVHVDKSADGYDGVYGGFRYGGRNPEGDRILEFGDATEMAVGNTFFKKRDSRLVTYQSGNQSASLIMSW